MKSARPEIDSSTAMISALAASGLDHTDAKKLHMEAFSGARAVELTGFDIPGFKIPYFDVDGKETDFWRYRFLGKRAKNKYFQLKGSPVRVYFPPLTDWAARIKDTSMPIFITEGEKKAACATKNDVCTIGLGGVWSFGSKVKLQELIPDLEQIKWSGRDVYICYDSDADQNVGIIQAENALAQRLVNRGARVHIIRLPSLSKDGKTGLDDYLIDKHGGRARLLKLVDKAEEWKTSSELRKFNEEVIFIRDPGVCVIRATGQRVSARDLVMPLYADRKYLKPTPTDADPNKVTQCSVPKEWLEWPGRAVASKMAYSPGEGEITKQGEYNQWKGWGAKPVKGNIKPWTTLLDYVFKDTSPEHRKWFEQWCAYPIQHPGTKLYTAVVFWSFEQGTGKTLVGYTLGRIYGDNYKEIGDRDLDSAFNAYATNRQFILADEITGAGGGEKRQLGNKLKGMITGQRIEVNQKYIPTYEIKDCINYLFTSNHCDVLFLEGKDRRYFVVEIKGEPLPAEWYTTTYDHWYRSERGINALMHHLKTLDLTGFEPFRPAPMTEDKQIMIEDSRSDMSEWIHSCWGTGEVRGMHALMTTEELLLRANKPNWSKNGLSRALRQEGFRQPLGMAQLKLPDGRNVRPWLINQAVNIPRKVSQEWMRALWIVDRVERAPEYVGPIIDHYDEKGNFVGINKRMEMRAEDRAKYLGRVHKMQEEQQKYTKRQER